MSFGARCPCREIGLICSGQSIDSDVTAKLTSWSPHLGGASWRAPGAALGLWWMSRTPSWANWASAAHRGPTSSLWSGTHSTCWRRHMDSTPNSNHDLSCWAPTYSTSWHGGDWLHAISAVDSLTHQVCQISGSGLFIFHRRFGFGAGPSAHIGFQFLFVPMIVPKRIIQLHSFANNYQGSHSTRTSSTIISSRLWVLPF